MEKLIKKAVSKIKYRQGVRSVGKQPRKRSRAVFFRGRPMKIPVYERGQLNPGFEAQGPAIIEQKDSTIFVLDNNLLTVDGMGNILINVIDRF